MTEARYLQVFADSSDALLTFVGIDQAYHDRGGSYFTVETHIMHLKEVRALEPIHTTTQVLSVDEKRLHVFQTMIHTPTGDALATAEQMLLHVDTKAQRACPAEPAVLARLREVAEAHAGAAAAEGCRAGGRAEEGMMQARRLRDLVSGYAGVARICASKNAIVSFTACLWTASGAYSPSAFRST